MSARLPVLHMVCGKAGAGKSTLCGSLAGPGSILIVQDAWMATLYKEELQTVLDYVRLVARLRAALGPHIVDLLRAGLGVVLDWPANTLASRAWMRGIFEAAGAGHVLHVLEVPDEVCLARLERRNAEGKHAFKVSRAEFEELSRYFEPPTDAEGFTIVRHGVGRLEGP
jgi:predicted kinase